MAAFLDNRQRLSEQAATTLVANTLSPLLGLCVARVLAGLLSSHPCEACGRADCGAHQHAEAAVGAFGRAFDAACTAARVTAEGDDEGGDGEEEEEEEGGEGEGGEEEEEEDDCDDYDGYDDYDDYDDDDDDDDEEEEEEEEEEEGEEEEDF